MLNGSSLLNKGDYEYSNLIFKICVYIHTSSICLMVAHSLNKGDNYNSDSRFKLSYIWYTYTS